MIPKEKAIDLMANFYAIKSNEPDYGMEWEMAKECALIAVDEILKEFKSDELYSSGENNINDFIIYWQEIKQEIEKLCKDNQ